MKFISTRGNKERFDAAYAIKTGLASDGGLFMPEGIPAITKDELSELMNCSYQERSARIIGKFLTDYTYDELFADASAAYSEEKFGISPAPLTKLSDGQYVLELWHGPTCAFKDMALQIMPRLFTRALKKCGEEREAMILVATSGDTGKAALEGYRDVKGTKIKVFYPVDGVSRVQKLQMQTQEGENVSVDAIVGNFDDAQSGVKRIFSDPEIKATLDKEGVFLSSANSINWGRLVPQIVYYVSAYLDMVKSGEIVFGESIDICVPTGNFGNIFAAYIGKLMGMPFEKFICASNVNNVLTDFLASGTYDRNRPFHATSSPSMDILISSNLERLLYTLIGSEATAQYMYELSNDGKYTLRSEEFKKVKESFVGLYTTEEETAATIKEIYEKENYLIDTHTAVAVCAAKRYMNAYGAERKILTASTASPYKFARDVFRAVSGKDASGDIEALSELSALTSTKIPDQLATVLKKSILHTGVISKSEMEKSVLCFAKN